jgi:hypothetical protein
MKIKRSDVLVLENVFTGMLQEKMHPDLAYAIASNVVVISEGAEKIRKSYKPVDGHDVYEKERTKLLNKIGKADANGRYSFSPDQAVEFKKLEEELNKTHADVIKDQAEYTKKFNLMLEKDIKLDLEKINLKEMTVDIEPAKLVILIKAGIIDNGSSEGDVQGSK